jgi:BTB/POZ domain-containing protein KCTD9
MSNLVTEPENPIMAEEPKTEPKPRNWSEMKTWAGSRPRWARPFDWLGWGTEWTAYWLSNWALIKVIEYLGKLSLVVGVIFYFMEAPTRRKQAQYDAWRVITSNEGKTGSGGRIQALRDLNKDGVDLSGVDLHKAFLRGIYLPQSILSEADLSGAILTEADLSGAILSKAKLSGADLNGAYLTGANLSGANLSYAYLSYAYLTGANLSGADLSRADLHSAHLSGANLHSAHLSRANLIVANLSGADLSWADLSVANLSEANLSGAKLTKADLSGAYLVGAMGLLTPA